VVSLPAYCLMRSTQVVPNIYLCKKLAEVGNFRVLAFMKDGYSEYS
jgi:hypothetical protein